MSSARGWKPIYLGVLFLLTGAEGVDATLDLLSEGFSTGVLLDLVLVPMVAGGVIYLVRSMSVEIRRVEKDNQRMRADLAEFRAKNADVLERMGAAVHEQFRSWGLSSAETTVAEFLLRGTPTRDIAARLGKSERTVRNQAAAVYRKPGMLGRNDLAAFFMTDILGDEEQESEERREHSA